MSSEPTPAASGGPQVASGSSSGYPKPVSVVHVGGDRFDINVRGHVIRTDQPVSDGGEDTGPTPTELFIASLSGCVAFYARRYLERHSLPTEGLVVEADFSMGSRPARVARIDVRVTIPDGVPAERREALLAVASHCTVHNSLMAVPEISVAFADADADDADESDESREPGKP